MISWVPLEPFLLLQTVSWLARECGGSAHIAILSRIVQGWLWNIIQCNGCWMTSLDQCNLFVRSACCHWPRGGQPKSDSPNAHHRYSQAFSWEPRGVITKMLSYHLCRPAWILAMKLAGQEDVNHFSAQCQGPALYLNGLQFLLETTITLRREKLRVHKRAHLPEQLPHHLITSAQLYALSGILSFHNHCTWCRTQLVWALLALSL